MKISEEIIQSINNSYKKKIKGFLNIIENNLEKEDLSEKQRLKGLDEKIKKEYLLANLDSFIFKIKSYLEESDLGKLIIDNDFYIESDGNRDFIFKNKKNNKIFELTLLDSVSSGYEKPYEEFMFVLKVAKYSNIYPYVEMMDNSMKEKFSIMFNDSKELINCFKRISQIFYIGKYPQNYNFKSSSDVSITRISCKNVEDFNICLSFDGFSFPLKINKQISVFENVYEILSEYLFENYNILNKNDFKAALKERKRIKKCIKPLIEINDCFFVLEDNNLVQWNTIYIKNSNDEIFELRFKVEKHDEIEKILNSPIYFSKKIDEDKIIFKRFMKEDIKINRTEYLLKDFIKHKEEFLEYLNLIEY